MELLNKEIDNNEDKITIQEKEKAKLKATPVQTYSEEHHF